MVKIVERDTLPITFSEDQIKSSLNRAADCDLALDNPAFKSHVKCYLRGVTAQNRDNLSLKAKITPRAAMIGAKAVVCVSIYDKETNSILRLDIKGVNNVVGVTNISFDQVCDTKSLENNLDKLSEISLVVEIELTKEIDGEHDETNVHGAAKAISTSNIGDIEAMGRASLRASLNRSGCQLM